jgi:ATP-dependent DNA helicase RecG
MFSQADNIKAVKDYYETLSKKIFPDLKLALVHGKMPTREKDAAMDAYASGEAVILVATTVVEVGVDVPNAALIIIENADRFGLSQLHQLRGRVGRGEHDSYCVLVRTEGAGFDANSRSSIDLSSGADLNKNSKNKPHPHDRLEVMKSTSDGFKIAEEDLKHRGPGDFFGSRQHGLPKMRIAGFDSLGDEESGVSIELINQAQNAAVNVLRDDPNLESPDNRKLAAQINRMFEINADKLN